MSAFGGKADVNQGVVKCPLIAISGHWWATENLRSSHVVDRASLLPTRNQAVPTNPHIGSLDKEQRIDDLVREP